MSDEVLEDIDLEMVARVLSPSIALVRGELERGTPSIHLAVVLSALSMAVANEEPLTPRHIVTQLAEDLCGEAADGAHS